MLNRTEENGAILSINIRGSAECLGGCMMSVSWHCIKPQERPGRAAYRKMRVKDGRVVK